MAALRVRVGTGAGLVTRKGQALLFIPEPGEHGEALLESFRNGVSATMLDTIGETVVAEGFNVAPFALVVLVDSKVQLRVFGDLEVTTTLRTAPMLSGKGSGTWVDHFGALIDEITVYCGASADDRTDLIEGTVLGGGVELIVDPASSPMDEPVPERKPEPEAEPITEPETESEPDDEVAPEPEPYNQAHLLNAFEDVAPTPQEEWAPPAPPSTPSAPSTPSTPPPPGATDLVTPGGSHTLGPAMAGALRADLASYVLVFDDGTVLDVAGLLVLGRKPIVEDVHEVGVPIEGDRVSRTHLRVSPVDGELYVTDLGSRNGSAVVWAATGEPEKLEADLAKHIGVGDRVVFGSQAFTVQDGEAVRDD